MVYERPGLPEPTLEDVLLRFRRRQPPQLPPLPELRRHELSVRHAFAAHDHVYLGLREEPERERPERCSDLHHLSSTHRLRRRRQPEEQDHADQNAELDHDELFGVVCLRPALSVADGDPEQRCLGAVRIRRGGEPDIVSGQPFLDLRRPKRTHDDWYGEPWLRLKWQPDLEERFVRSLDLPVERREPTRACSQEY